MSQLDKWMTCGKISSLVIVISDKDTGERVERWQFDVRDAPRPHGPGSRDASLSLGTLADGTFRSKSLSPLPSTSRNRPPPASLPTTTLPPPTRKTPPPPNRLLPKIPRPRSRPRSPPSSARSPPRSPSSPSSPATAPSTCSSTPMPTATCPSSGATRTPRRSQTASTSSSAASALPTIVSTPSSATGWGTESLQGPRATAEPPRAPGAARSPRPLARAPMSSTPPTWMLHL